MPSRVAPLPAVAPIIPILRSDAFDDPEWLFEPKFDGFRGMLYLDGSKATLISKQQRELARFSGLAEEVRDILNVRNAILDGEVVAIDDEDRPNFRGLMSHQGHLHYAAFDVLWLNGKDLRRQSLTKRRQQLKRLITATTPILSHTMAVPGNGRALFGAVQRLDLEGIIAKRASDPYNPKSVWFKVKNRLYSQQENRFERLSGK
jgi:bifunctional non-homologous end joining protein LigD